MELNFILIVVLVLGGGGGFGGGGFGGGGGGVYVLLIVYMFVGLLKFCKLSGRFYVAFYVVALINICT